MATEGRPPAEPHRVGRSKDTEGWRAADAPATRTFMRLRFVVCTFGVVVGLAALALGLASWAEARTGPDLPTGSNVAVGTLTEINRLPGGGVGGSTELRFTFADATGTVHSANFNIGRAQRQYALGDEIEIAYDTQHPDRVTPYGNPSELLGIPWYVPLVFGCGLLFASLATSRRLRWTAQVLHDNPWVMAQSTLLEMAIDDRGRPVVMRMVELVGAPESDAVLATPVGWRAHAISDLAPAAWVAGSDRRFLAAAPGGAPIRCLRRVRLRDERPVLHGPPKLPSRFEPT